MRTVRFVSCVFVLLTLATTACSGNVVPHADGTGGAAVDGAGGAATEGTGGSVGDDGVGGTSQDGASGGSGNAPGAGGSQPATGGASGVGGEPPVCCGATAVCDDERDLQVDSQNGCPIAQTCYSRTVCCSTVWCMEAQAYCEAIPLCFDGEVQVDTCPEGEFCVKRAACNNLVTCQQNEALCDRDAQPFRKYLGQRSECVDLEFSCPEHTRRFNDVCGCGCEQPENCPLSVSCLPSGEVHPLCNADECPYTARPQ